MNDAVTDLRFVPRNVFQAVRDHALEELAQSLGRESCGWLLVDDDGHAVDYQRSRNVATGPYRFQMRDDLVEPAVLGARAIVTHSHPDYGDAEPSEGDLENARARDETFIAIYSTRMDRLEVWHVLDDGAEPVAVRIEKPRRRPTTRRYATRSR